jgi:chromatin segregation and condensation protein Rec8/ScpA/Scc1 (kleisin family)
MKQRNNYLKELQRRREAAKSTEAPEPEAPEKLPSDPEVRAVWLQDELTNTREQLAKEREKRQQAERRLEAIETPAPKSMADVLRRVQAGKHKTWR